MSLLGDLQTYADAIASIESGGRYDLIGPTHPRYGRALGRYQVMEINLGPWLSAAGLPPMSPEQFLADPSAQDAVFAHRFGGYVQQFGAAGAAQAWFAGPGSVGRAGSGSLTDSLGTTVSSYVARFQSAVATLGTGGSLGLATPAGARGGIETPPPPGAPGAIPDRPTGGLPGYVTGAVDWLTSLVNRSAIIILGIVVLGVGLALFGRTRPASVPVPDVPTPELPPVSAPAGPTRAPRRRLGKRTRRA